jgi:hypothetical protein
MSMEKFLFGALAMLSLGLVIVPIYFISCRWLQWTLAGSFMLDMAAMGRFVYTRDYAKAIFCAVIVSILCVLGMLASVWSHL